MFTRNFQKKKNLKQMPTKILFSHKQIVRVEIQFYSRSKFKWKKKRIIKRDFIFSIIFDAWHLISTGKINFVFYLWFLILWTTIKIVICFCGLSKCLKNIIYLVVVVFCFTHSVNREIFPSPCLCIISVDVDHLLHDQTLDQSNEKLFVLFFVLQH